jgi:hypothetical protein
MTSHITPRHLWRGAGAASLIAVIFIAGAAQAAGDPGKPSRFKIDWSACEKSPQAQCGTLRVPIDWSKPSGATVSLAVARRPAKDQQQRVGTLFFNPGGPGDGAAKYIVEVAEKVFSPTLLERFDLVGMDPPWLRASAIAHRLLRRKEQTRFIVCE